MSETNQLKVASFDASDYLDSEEVIAEYLTIALKDPDPHAFLTAVRDVAKARGIATVAANAGLGRESLYKTLKPGAQPRFDTVRRLLEALGVDLGVSPMHTAVGSRRLKSKLPS
jgi:probable addiction module antidote protein